MFNRINPHIHTTEYLNKNQFCFRQQTSTIVAVKALTVCVEEGFSSGEVTVLVNLDVEGHLSRHGGPAF